MSDCLEPETCAECDWTSGVFVGADQQDKRSASPRTRAMAWLWNLDQSSSMHGPNDRERFIDRFEAEAKSLIDARGATP